MKKSYQSPNISPFFSSSFHQLHLPKIRLFFSFSFRISYWFYAGNALCVLKILEISQVFSRSSRNSFKLLPKSWNYIFLFEKKINFSVVLIDFAFINSDVYFVSFLQLIGASDKRYDQRKRRRRRKERKSVGGKDREEGPGRSSRLTGSCPRLEETKSEPAVRDARFEPEIQTGTQERTEAIQHTPSSREIIDPAQLNTHHSSTCLSHWAISK